MKKMPCAIARSAVFLCVVLLMTSNIAYSQTPKNFAQARREFKTFYEQGLRKNGIVGSSFMLIQDGQVIAQEFFGQANQEKQQPVDENTIYHWASITKTFTSIAIMQLRDRGLLKLDDLPRLHPDELRIEATCQAADERQLLYGFTARHGATQLASGRITVVLQPPGHRA